MLKLLVPVDGSDSSIRVTEYVISLSRTIGPIEIILLNVQPRIESGNVRLFVSKDQIDTYYREEGEAAVAPVQTLLDAAKVSYKTYIEVGHIAPAIAAFAKKHHCDGIAMGTRGRGGISGLLLGSIASQVLHLAEVPVTFVK